MCTVVYLQSKGLCSFCGRQWLFFAAVVDVGGFGSAVVVDVSGFAEQL